MKKVIIPTKLDQVAREILTANQQEKLDAGHDLDFSYVAEEGGRFRVNVFRKAGAKVVLTSEDEWYKAAYYDASALGYNRYPFADGFVGAACEVPAGSGTAWMPPASVHTKGRPEPWKSMLLPTM